MEIFFNDESMNVIFYSEAENRVVRGGFATFDDQVHFSLHQDVYWKTDISSVTRVSRNGYEWAITVAGNVADLSQLYYLEQVVVVR